MNPHSIEDRVKGALRDVPDFPSPGILFKDITPLLQDPALFSDVIDAMAAPFADARITHVLGIESRGFIFGAPVAERLRAGFVPVRKPGKLPSAVTGIDYALEYGTDRLEVHRDAFGPRSRVLIVDDVLATGGTAAAASALVDLVGASVVGLVFLLEISALRGSRRLEGYRVEAIART